MNEISAVTSGPVKGYNECINNYEKRLRTRFAGVIKLPGPSASWRRDFYLRECLVFANSHYPAPQMDITASGA